MSAQNAKELASNKRSSDLAISLLLGLGGFLSRIEVGWVGELSIVVLVVEGGDGLLTHGDEVVNENLVGNIGVKVILEVLNLIHLGLDALVSSDSWERERSIEELPRVDLWWLHTELISDLHGVLVVVDIELPGELVHLPVQLVLVEPESIFTALGGEGINNAIILVGSGDVLKSNEGFDLLLVGGDDSEEKS